MLKFWTKSNSKKKFEKQLKRITFTEQEISFVAQNIFFLAHFCCFRKKTKDQNFYVCKKMRSGWGFLTQTIWRIFLQNEKF